MKMLALFALAITAINSTPAAAVPTPTREDLILKHPMVFAIEKLMDDKDAGQCVLPMAKDIRWMCTGAIMPVTAPRLDTTECGFSIEVKCPSQTAQIYGQEVMFFLNQPLDAKNPIKVDPVSGGTNITGVNFK